MSRLGGFHVGHADPVPSHVAGLGVLTGHLSDGLVPEVLGIMHCADKIVEAGPVSTGTVRMTSSSALEASLLLELVIGLHEALCSTLCI